MTSQMKTLFLMALLSAIIIILGGAIGGRSGIIMALVFALIMNVGSYWYSDKIVLSMYHARELSPQEAPLLHQIVGELAQNAGVPMPRVYLVPQEAPNAFATGRDPEHSAVAVTEGIMQLLNPRELRGVLAHEMAHVANRDILIQTIAGVMASAITAIANYAQFAAIFGSRDENGERSNPLAMMLMALLAPLAAGLIQMAISRTREYNADATGARFCRDPLALAAALNKLTTYSAQIPLRGNPSTENMFIVSPFAGRSMAQLFSTHPPMEDRIARLQDMAANGLQSSPSFGDASFSGGMNFTSSDEAPSAGSGWEHLQTEEEKPQDKPAPSGWEHLMDRPQEQPRQDSTQPDKGEKSSSGWDRFKS